MAKASSSIKTVEIERKELAEDLLDLYTLRVSEPCAISLEDYKEKRKIKKSPTRGCQKTHQ